MQSGIALVLLATMLAGTAPVDASSPLAQETDVPYDAERPSPLRTVDVFYQQRHPTAARPALLVFHGGGWTDGEKEAVAKRADSWARFDDWVVFAAGYDYNAGDRWRSLPQDLDSLLAWVAGPAAAEYNIDITRVGLVGISAGGHLALMAGLRQDHWPPGLQVAAVSAWLAPTDLVEMVMPCGQGEVTCPRQAGGPWYAQRYAANCPYAECYGGQSRVCFLTAAPACLEHYTDNSPILHVDEDDPPIQLYASTMDDIIPFTQTTSLEEALEDAGVYRDCAGTPEAGHSVPAGALEGTRAFFRAFLGGTGNALNRECQAG